MLLRTTPPSAAARKAAVSATDAMSPPGRSSVASRCASRSAPGSPTGNALPQTLSQRRIRIRERNDGAQPPGEGRVQRAAGVGGQDRQPAERLHPLQQVGDLEIGVPVVAVAHLGALAEQRVGLVEQQHRAAVLGGVEHLPQLLLGLADVLAHHLARSIWTRSRSRAPATTSAASVLPVPLGPANNAVVPSPGWCGRRNPSRREPGRGVRPMRRARAAARSARRAARGRPTSRAVGPPGRDRGPRFASVPGTPTTAVRHGGRPPRPRPDSRAGGRTTRQRRRSRRRSPPRPRPPTPPSMRRAAPRHRAARPRRPRTWRRTRRTRGRPSAREPPADHGSPRPLPSPVRSPPTRRS